MAKTETSSQASVFAHMASAVRLTFTHEAEVYAAARGGKRRLERVLRREIAQLFSDGLPNAENLLVHIVSWRETNDILIRGAPRGMQVDLCRLERVGDRRISIPVPASAETVEQ